MKVSIKSVFKSPEGFMGKKLEISGWIRTIRDGKEVGFIELNDGSFFTNIQVVYNNTLDNFDEINQLTIGSSIHVVGTLVESPAKGQAFEIDASDIKIITISPHEYPLQKKRHTPEYLRTIAHLRPKTNMHSAAFKMRSVVSFLMHKFFYERGFVYCHTPIVTTSDAEGAGDMFQVTTLDLDKVERPIDYSKDFFGKKAFLTVSGQLQVESFAQAYGKAYTFGPTFRAENSNTPRHLAEFWMIEPEIAFCDLACCMDNIEDLIKYVIENLFIEAKEELEFCNQFIDKNLITRLQVALEKPFERITYTKAIELLEASDKDFEYPVSWGIDLQTEHERYICETHFNGPVFVTDYPKDIKAFYMRLNEDEKTVAATDLLVPEIGELVGGSQREERYDVLLQKIRDSGLNEDEYWWYLELRKYGGVGTSGYGIGFERFIRYLTGIENIRDVMPFPRYSGHADF